MKRTALFFATVLFTIVFFNSSTNAQTTGNGHGAKINWVDANGDGICDNVGTALQGVNRTGKGYGKKDGTGVRVQPQDGTGFGAKAGNLTGTGTCDGTGSKGTMARKGRK